MRISSAFHSSLDFKYSTPFSNRSVEHLVRSATPEGMMDLLEEDAANSEATPLHDAHFQNCLDTEEGTPSQFVKWVAEMAIKADLNPTTFCSGKTLML